MKETSLVISKVLQRKDITNTSIELELPYKINYFFYFISKDFLKISNVSKEYRFNIYFMK